MARSFLLAWVWAGVIVFLVACTWRGWRYARAPLHLRWELYPVAHEPARRRRAMLEEIVLLRAVWQHNRRLFWASLPFHWGLYALLATTVGVVAMGAGLQGAWVSALLASSGTIGGLLLAGGALGLLWLRSSDPGLRRYTSRLDRVNLALFAGVGALSASIALAPAGMEAVADDVARLLRFQAPLAPPLHAAHMALTTLILSYLPFTRMVHFFAKYFLYHHVRWDERPVQAGSRLESHVRGALDLGVGWSADHVGAGRSWAEVAREGPPDPRRPA